MNYGASWLIGWANGGYEMGERHVQSYYIFSQIENCCVQKLLLLYFEYDAWLNFFKKIMATTIFEGLLSVSTDLIA